tara:strand:- start:133 stop:507 length:375 start_codon:yes stop_codon:yes gene_type:complete
MRILETEFNMSFEGIYAAYFAGKLGNSLGMFIFRDGEVSGADYGGGVYDGHYEVNQDGKTYSIDVTFVLPSESQSITGAKADSGPLKMDTHFTLPRNIDPDTVHELRTPIGPINARFQKIREIR